MNTAPRHLATALEALGETLPEVQFPLPIEGATQLRQLSSAVQHQLRDYLLPRAARLDAPLLAVVGGSTGAGKSTVVNSLLGAPVTKPGVLRPTTKSPVLIANPDDVDWFRSGKILPGLVRSETQVHDSRALQIVEFPGLPAGLALLDAPDIDSVDDDNRRLARQLLQAADLWLFVTSAARYADAVGWEVLQQAADRNAVVSLVLNRCPEESMEDLKSHLGEMLAARDVHASKLFAIPERDLPEDGMLQPQDTQPIRSWLASLAEQGEARADVAMQTLAGTVRSLDPQVAELVAGARRQADAVSELRGQAQSQFRIAADEVARSTSDGTMLRGEVLSRWQDFIGTGEFMRGVEEKISAWRDRLTQWFTGEQKVEAVQVAISDGLAALVVDHAQAACASTVSQWSLTNWGRQIVEAAPDLAHTTPDFDEEAARMVREWQAGVLQLVEDQGRGKRLKARALALGTNALGAALIIAVFSVTGGLTGTEIGIAGGTTVLAQRLLEGVFGEDAVRRLADNAKADLDSRVRSLLASQLARFEEILGQFGVEPEVADRLAAVADDLRAASGEAFDDLTRPEGF